MGNNNTLDTLDNTTALSILHHLATADPDYGELAARVPARLPLPLAVDAQATVARQLLHHLADDPQRALAIAQLSRAHPATRFDSGLSGMALLTCVVVLLRTHVRYQRKPDGTWGLTIEHKPADSKTLSALLHKLSALLPGGD